MITVASGGRTSARWPADRLSAPRDIRRADGPASCHLRFDHGSGIKLPANDPTMRSAAITIRYADKREMALPPIGHPKAQCVGNKSKVCPDSHSCASIWPEFGSNARRAPGTSLFSSGDSVIPTGMGHGGGFSTTAAGFVRLLRRDGASPGKSLVNQGFDTHMSHVPFLRPF